MLIFGNTKFTLLKSMFKYYGIYTEQIRAVAGQRSSPDLCFVTKSIKSTTKDIDLIVTQVGCDSTA